MKTSMSRQIHSDVYTNSRVQGTSIRPKTKGDLGRRPPNRYVFISMQMGNVEWEERGKRVKKRKGKKKKEKRGETGLSIRFKSLKGGKSDQVNENRRESISKQSVIIDATR